ncbi:MAG: CHASE3 domain-containing protein [Acidobacteria bacterium]|nr:CHASE3 domain-containing protein [Acidobacteriota bacterium]
MEPRRKASAVFIAAVILLLISAGSAYLSIVSLMQSQEWVVHSLEMQAALGDVDNAVAQAGRARTAFLATGKTSFLDDFEASKPIVGLSLQAIRGLAADNPLHRELSARLEYAVKRRIDLFEKSVELEKTRPDDDRGQDALTAEAVPISAEITETSKAMRREEQKLLAMRQERFQKSFRRTVFTLAFAFVLALGLLLLHYRLLSLQLRARENAETSFRTLSNHLTKMQDEERRRFSRELHDSLGQYLAAVKMNFAMLAQEHPNDGRYTESLDLLDQCMTETRTISYLLHPPILEIAGFSAAARWFAEGFSQRSGIEVTVEIPDQANQLPDATALVLFRILQESLTNIHRHAKSPSAEIIVHLLPRGVRMTIRDQGIGISPKMLRQFRLAGTGGVGLAAMQERVHELSGKFEITSTAAGTTVTVNLPLPEKKPIVPVLG